MAIAKQNETWAARPLKEDTESMRLLKLFSQAVATIANVAGPSYQPELHYMRGPGPACARREAKG
ncbi:hypothetical protein [Oricola sp.]|uniref:hypothetical protein n=1 Tax=Oricola sp. TaxID=1979950 RepID=UPI003BADB0C2